MKKWVIICAFSFISLLSNAIEVTDTLALNLLSTSGSVDYITNNTDTSMIVSWSLGEITTNFLSTTDISLSQGFNQSVIMATGIYKNDKPESDISLYPNPTNSNLNIQFNSTESAYKLIRLYNSQGQFIQQWRSTGTTKVEIPLHNHNPGLYIIRIFNKNEEHIYSGKVIKR